MPKNIKAFIKRHKFLYSIAKRLLSLRKINLKTRIKQASNFLRKRSVLKKQLTLPEIKAYFNELMQRDNIKICVQVHLFYLDLVDEIIRNLNYIPFLYHCYISTDTDEKAEIIQSEVKSRCKNAIMVYITKFDNRGRDVAPLIEQMKNNLNQYEYILHIHTKKSIMCNNSGNKWRKHLYKHLLGSIKNVYYVFCQFANNKNLGLLFSETFPDVVPLKWGEDELIGKNNVFEFLGKINVTAALSDVPDFPAGNMFWARTKSIQKIFDSSIATDDFPIEDGQLDLTLAHAIERSWVYIAQSEGYDFEYL